MKEQIFELLHNRQRMPGEHFSDVEGKIEKLVNQEVEKRIKERMVSERLRGELIAYTKAKRTYDPDMPTEIVDEYLKSREK